MFTLSILRHKHGNKHSIASALTLLSLLTSAVFPIPTFAAEATAIPATPVPTILSQVQSIASGISNKLNGNSNTSAQNSDYTSTAVVASASPVIVEANWKKPLKKVAEVKVKQPISTPIVMQGTASYYSRAGCLGCNPLFVMANGQVLDDNALTMAIGADKKHLVGYQAKVTNLANGQSTIVRITDTGGFYQDKYGNRVADLTIASKQAIGMKGGLGQVRVEVF